jgi:hypothetical protein
MKISEVLVESQLQEGPLGSLAGAIGRGVGKTVGGVAKGIGAVAGGIAGIGKAFKKGYHAGQGNVAGDDEDEPATKPAGGSGTAPASTAGGTAPAAQQPAAAPAAQQPAAAPAAGPADGSLDSKTPFGKLAGAAAGKPAAEPAANDSAYAQVQKAVNGLAPEQKKEIVAMLQADPKVKAAMAKPAAKKPAAKKPAAAPANTMANTPVSKTNKAKPGNPNAAAPAAPAAKPKAEPTAKMGTVKQKQLTNKGFSQMVGGLTKQNASIERTGNVIGEGITFFRKH